MMTLGTLIGNCLIIRIYHVLTFTVSINYLELGDGQGMFLDMYLLAIGWTETAVILSGILRGIVELSLKGICGDIIDKTQYDRRNFLSFAALAIAASSLLVFFVNGSETNDKLIVYTVRSLESVALALLGPAFSAITLSAFGAEMFDQMMVKKELVSHTGEIVSRVVSAVIGWVYYPNIEYVFILPAAFAASAIFFVRQIPKGNHLVGRGFHGSNTYSHTNTKLYHDDDGYVAATDEEVKQDEKTPVASSYRDVFTDRRIVAIIVADVFHVIAEANVGLIFNETLADVGTYSSKNQNNDDGGARLLQNYNGDGQYYQEITDDAVMSRAAIPLLATAGSAAQIVMIAGTWLVGYLTSKGVGRKPFYVVHLCIHSVRVLLIMLCLYTNAGKGWLVSTEFVGGLTGAFGIVNAFMRADILFGSGRFNVVDGFQATIRGVAASSAQYIGGVILERQGPMTALTMSFFIAIISPLVGAFYVPETLGMREKDFKEEKEEERLLKSMSVDEVEEESYLKYLHIT